MHLDLSKGGTLLKQRRVIHEFGHVLGLLHEHQRPDFWECISDYIDKDKMKRDKRADVKNWPESKFETFWATNYVSVSKGQMTPTTHVYTEYDPESIMHYP